MLSQVYSLQILLSYNVPNRLNAFARSAKESRVARTLPTCDPSAFFRAQLIIARQGRKGRTKWRLTLRL